MSVDQWKGVVRHIVSGHCLEVRGPDYRSRALYQMGTRVLIPLGVKRPRREADNSPPASAKVKETWFYTSTPHRSCRRNARLSTGTLTFCYTGIYPDKNLRICRRIIIRISVIYWNCQQRSVVVSQCHSSIHVTGHALWTCVSSGYAAATSFTRPTSFHILS
jgi:hypothetical protein